MIRAIVGIALVGAMGCKQLEEADQSLDEALKTSFVELRTDDETMARILRNLERQAYASLELGNRDVSKRSVGPTGLTEADVAHLSPKPDRDPALCTAVSTGHLSPFPIEEHAIIPTVEDQSGEGLEPQSPEHFNREFLSGEDCWSEGECMWLETRQDLTKVYTIVPPVAYAFMKDFRWVDMNAGLPDADGPRWAYIASSWNDDTYQSENGRNILWQSWTVEVWFPRDGRGFLWSEQDPELFPRPEGDFVDSDGDGGTFRLLTLWTEADLGIAVDDKTERGTIRWGMDQNFAAHDRWLEERAE